MSLNLAQRPFLNRQPVRRAGLTLGVIALGLAALNVYLYWNYLSGQGEAESGLQELVGQVEQETALFEAARADLEDFDPRGDQSGQPFLLETFIKPDEPIGILKPSDLLGSRGQWGLPRLQACDGLECRGHPAL